MDFGRGGALSSATSWRPAGAFGRGESGIEFGSDPPVSEVEWKFVRGANLADSSISTDPDPTLTLELCTRPV